MSRAGNTQNAFGQYFSFEPPVSVLQTRIDKVILPVWPTEEASVLEMGYAIKFPTGTILNVGEVTPHGNIFLGGTQQVVVEVPWLIECEALFNFPIK